MGGGRDITLRYVRSNSPAVGFPRLRRKPSREEGEQSLGRNQGFDVTSVSQGSGSGTVSRGREVETAVLK